MEAALPARLLALATASPPYELAQPDIARAARSAFDDPLVERLAPVFDTAGVRTRQTVRPIDWYLAPRGWPERTAVYLEGATALFVQAAGRALDEARLTAAEVDVVVTVSSTGIATPSLEARAMASLGLRSDVMRVPVFGLGCAGGASGLALAARLAEADPGAVVLMVTVELCSLAVRLDRLTKANIVATALFGDGAAAVILRAGEGGFAEVQGLGQHTFPETLDIMGWEVDPEGFGVVFAQAIPEFTRRNLRPAVDGLLAAQGLSLADIGRPICHPGGAKVISALEQALETGQGALDHERAVLADHGNMSAPTVLFVLDRARRAGLPRRALLTALGPGFTASAVTLGQAA